jgi:hypothetical protein
MKLGKIDLTLTGAIDCLTNISSVDVHPVRDWLLIGEQAGVVHVWNYGTKTLLKSIDLAELDSLTSTLRQVKFMDWHVLRWKWVKVDIALNAETFLSTAERRNWLVVVLESKVTFFDYFTSAALHITLPDLDNKQPTCVEIIDSSNVAVGCADGSLRLWDCKHWALRKVFPRGVHGKAITSLVSFSTNIRQRPLLAAASADGVLAVWNCDTSSTVPAYRLGTHSGSVMSMSYNPELMHLVTVGVDKVVAVWNASNSTEVAKYRSLKDQQKKPLVGACYLRNLAFLSSSVLAAYSRSGQIFLVDSLMSELPKERQEYSKILDLAQVLGAAVKLVSVLSHPVKTWMFFTVTDQSIQAFSCAAELKLPAVFHQAYNSQVLARDVGSTMKQPGGQSHFCYVFKDNALQTLTFNPNEEGGLDSQFFEVYKPARPCRHAEVKSSASGHYLSVLNLQIGLYEVFKVFEREFSPTFIPDKLKTAYALKLEWHSQLDRFAVLSPVNEDGEPGSFFSVNVSILLLVYEVNPRGTIALIYRGDSIPSPTNILGGSLLAVTSSAWGVHPTKLFFWESMSDAGLSLPAVKSVYWAAAHAICAFDEEFYVYSMGSSLKFQYKLEHAV